MPRKKAPRALITERSEAYELKLARQRARYRDKKKEKENRPLHTDMILRALGEDEGRSSGDENIVEDDGDLFPGSDYERLDFLKIAVEVLEKYKESGRDLSSDYKKVMRLGRTGKASEIPEGLVPAARSVYKDDRTDLIAGALVLLLSWLQRKRVEIIGILLDSNSGGKQTRFQNAIMDLLVGPGDSDER